MSNVELRQMILNFRVSELQVLLGFAGRNKSGKKQELQYRALELLKHRSTPINMKIQQLHKQRFPPNTSVINSIGPCHLYGALPTLPHITGLDESITGNQMVPGNSLYYDYTSPKHAGSSAQSGYNMAKYPLHPDVRLKPLPFYDVLAELLRPSSLLPKKPGRFQEDSFAFHLTPQQAHDIAMSRTESKDYGIQVQMRFCLLETTCEQEDNFPPSICVRVNSKMCSLPNPIPTNKPGVEPKRPSRPVIITGLCRLCSNFTNHINVTWASEYVKGYSIAVYLVRRLSSSTLLTHLRSLGIRNPDHTRAMIKEKLQHDPDSEIATTSLRGSLICPLGKTRIQIPCRSITCLHLQCFDASFFLQMNEKKPTWLCPVCDRSAVFNNLVIDGLFTEILAKAPAGCLEVQFYENGSWTPVLSRKDKLIIGSPTVEKTAFSSLNQKKKPHVEVVDLTIESNSEEEEEDFPLPPSQPVNLFPFSVMNTQQFPSSPNIDGTHGPVISLPSSSVPPLSQTNSFLSSSLSTLQQYHSSDLSMPFISLASPSSPSSSNSSFSTIMNSPVPQTTLTSTIPSDMQQYNNSIFSMTSYAGSSMTAVLSSTSAGSTEISMSKTGLHTPVPSSVYSNMPLIDSDTSPYYPSDSSFYSDFLIQHSNHSSSYQNLSDLHTNLNDSESDRQIPSFSAAAGMKLNSAPPDIISLE
ncbi:E3 SUMO-protein ligase PIAS2-like isoform X2 [Limulus polyphemus]|uniref:E3 SUMO-protein ligase PIAS2-like isoform X2 n=1 Tax=Limulus polyphemus TaxID=6850 RepID=A0ABM1S179_LIMPO|nr:E3 SUMO-protein ligase PIAS2-like isoform X2 [Limulus polyphemus]